MIAKILASIREKLEYESHVLHLTVSVGIASYPVHGDNSDDLLKNADAAMYAVKRRGRNGFGFFNDSLNRQAMERLERQNDLYRALEKNEFEIHYQPKLRLEDGSITGLEALVRWRHPELGMISPADFIPLAEETGLIVPLGELVLKSACEQNVKFQAKGFAPLNMAVNISPSQFLLPDIGKRINKILSAVGMDYQYLEIEITEGTVMHEPEAASRTLQSLADQDIKIAIDDFGTGYSSLAYLKRYPIHTLKIDRSFINEMNTSMEDLAIVKAIITLARSLKLKVVAEGVETVSQIDLLRTLACDEIQGYFYSKPLPAPELVQFLFRRQKLEPIGGNGIV